MVIARWHEFWFKSTLLQTKLYVIITRNENSISSVRKIFVLERVQLQRCCIRKYMQFIVEHLYSLEFECWGMEWVCPVLLTATYRTHFHHHHYIIFFTVTASIKNCLVLLHIKMSLQTPNTLHNQASSRWCISWREAETIKLTIF